MESLADQKRSADRTFGKFTALEKYQKVLFFERQLNKISLALSSKNRNTVKKHPEHRNIRNVRTIRTIRNIRNIKKKHPNSKNRFCIRCRDSKDHLEFYFFKVFRYFFIFYYLLEKLKQYSPEDGYNTSDCEA